MLAEVVDAVVGGDTHRDTHALELTAPSGATIATLMIGNDERGFAEAIAWVAEHAPGPRVVVGLEGTRSYGIGLARVLQAAGLTVVEIERPRRGERRRGKSDPIDAHLAALHALRLDADRLPTPRADGDREALRILLGARRELTTAKTRTINRLRALLLTGSDADRALADNKCHLADLVTHLGAATAGQTRRGPGQRRPGDRVLVPTRAAAATMPHTPRSPAPARSPPAAAASSVTGSTAAATATSTAPCTTSS
jgi:transposase